MTPDEFFAGHPLARHLFARIQQEVNALGPATLHTTKSQVAFRRRRAFAWVWRPAQYLPQSPVPLVLSIALPGRDGSPRWKQVVEPAPGRFMHHLEVRATTDIDAEVRQWLRQAWDAA